MQKGTTTHPEECQYIPNVWLCLISIGWLSNDGLQALFTTITYDIQCRSKMVTRGTQHGKGLYTLTDHVSVEHINIACATATLETWHRQLSHMNYTSIMTMAKKGLVTGMPTSLSYLPQICEHCILAKQTCIAVPKMWEGEGKEATGESFLQHYRS